MSELVAFVFRDQFRAPEVLNELRRREWAWVRDLDEAVAVTVNEYGKARVHLSVDLSTYAGARWARIWGTLFSTTLFMPLTEVMVEAADGVVLAGETLGQTLRNHRQTCESEWWRKSLQEARNFKRDVAALMAPNGSAIFMMFRTQDAMTVLKQLRNYGDTIVHTSVSSEQDEALLKILSTCGASRS